MPSHFRFIPLSGGLLALALVLVPFVFPSLARSYIDYPVKVFALSGDGKRMAVAGRAIDSAETTDGQYYPIDIYDVVAGKLIDTINPIWPMTDTIALNFDGKMVAYKTTQGLRVTEVGTRKRLYSFDLEEKDYADRFIWSPVDSRLLVFTGRGHLYLLDARKPDSAVEFQNHSQIQGVKDADWSGDGAELALMTSDHTIHFWDTAANKVIRTILCDCGSEFAWQPQGRLIVTPVETTIRTVDAMTGETVASSPDDQYLLATEMAWSRNGQRIAVGTADSGLVLYDLTLQFAPTTYSGDGNIGSVYWGPNGDVFHKGLGNEIYRNNEEITLDTSDIRIPQVAHLHQTVSYDILGLGISHDGTRLAVTGRSLWHGTYHFDDLSPIDLYSTRTGMLLNTVENVKGSPVQMTFSPDDRMIAYGDDGDYGSLGIVDLASEQILCGYLTSMGPNHNTKAAWSTDGIRAALMSSSNLSVFDTRQRKEIIYIPAPQEAPQSQESSIRNSKFTAMDWIPDFDWIITATDDSIQVWDLTKSIETPGLTYRGKGTTALAANPAQPGLFAAGQEHSAVFFYDIFENALVDYLQAGDTGAFYNMAWSPNGKYLAAAAPDQVVIFDYNAKTILVTYSTPDYVANVAWANNHDLFFATISNIYKNGQPFPLKNQAGESTSPPTLMPPPPPVPTYAIGG